MIGESDLNDVRLITSTQNDGYGLDGQWSDDFHHALHALLTGERFGYYQDYGLVSDLAKALQEGFVYDWKYSKFRKRNHGSSSALYPASRFVICIQNHDQIGNRMRGDRIGHLVDFERLKLAAGCVLLSPYIPLLFMGQEYGEVHPFQYFISMFDEDLVEAVRQGRAEEFLGFEWTGQCPDPQAVETFEGSKLQWDQRQQNRHGVLLKFYQQLIQLRKRQLNYVSKADFEVETIEEKKVLLWRRGWDASTWLCVMNFSDQPQVMACPNGIKSGRKMLNSADNHWDGPGSSMPDELDEKIDFELPPNSVCLYEVTSSSR